MLKNFKKKILFSDAYLSAGGDATKRVGQLIVGGIYIGLLLYFGRPKSCLSLNYNGWI